MFAYLVIGALVSFGFALISDLPTWWRVHRIYALVLGVFGVVDGFQRNDPGSILFGGALMGLTTLSEYTDTKRQEPDGPDRLMLA